MKKERLEAYRFKIYYPYPLGGKIEDGKILKIGNDFFLVKKNSDIEFLLIDLCKTGLEINFKFDGIVVFSYSTYYKQVKNLYIVSVDDLYKMTSKGNSYILRKSEQIEIKNNIEFVDAPSVDDEDPCIEF